VKPTQTGLGERSHLLSKSIDLDVFVTDITNVIKYKDLNDVVLVGHSFGIDEPGAARLLLLVIAEDDQGMPNRGGGGTAIRPSFGFVHECMFVRSLRHRIAAKAQSAT
jgi:hypothetical protein